MELKYFTNQGREEIKSGFNSFSEILAFYYKLRKSWKGANFAKWKKPGGQWEYVN